MKHKGMIITTLGILFLVVALATLVPSSSGQGLVSGQLWQTIDANSIVSRGKRVIIPKAFRALRLNKTALTETLNRAPLEFTAAARTTQTVLSVPMPDGSFDKFRIEESPIMEPGLAARFPNIKTYRGQGIDDPTATARFDLTPAGFHAIVLSPTDTVYVDPYAKGDTVNYISYFKRDLAGDPNYECRFGDFGNPSASTPQTLNGEGFAANVAAHAGTLRTYRLALAVTGEYTLYHAPDLLEADASRKQKAFAALVTTQNRVNGIYEREVSVRMILVEDELEIIYTNPATDPYQSDMVLGVSMLVENQINLDTPEPVGPIGEGNYDIGHVMSTGFGGVAFLESVCQRGEPSVPGDGENAGGFTGLDTPEGDAFDVDFVAHEMGHQFGGNHTFNGSEGSCSGNAEGPAAMEPGSGSTIQAYAGICGSQDLQPHSDAYFHSKSLEELIAFTQGNGQSLERDGNSCSTQSPVNNAPPVVNGGADYTIPKNTPFVLSATGSDPDGDAITYAWEEYDTGPPSPPDTDTDGQPRPIFRSYNPTTNPSRNFPGLQYILNNANTPPQTYDCGRGAAEPCLTGEILPQITRTMKFQVTVRDNRAAGGGVNSDLVNVNVRAESGPFIVTAPNTNVAWPGNSTQTVMWDVANTNAAPVNAANVRISLSVDGGQTFPFVLAATTPNDGAETITLPNAQTASARIKVEAVDNIFFDISNTDFQITLDQSLCLTNHALASNGATASASSVYDSRNYSPMSAIDGDRIGLNWEAGGGWNDATRDAYPDWLEVNFGAQRTIGLVRVVTLQDDFKNPVVPAPSLQATLYGLLDYEIQTWNGSAWVTAPGGSVTGNNLVMRTFVLPAITTDKIRVLVHNARQHHSRIVEVEAFGCDAQ
ncbi:MAG TPA: zinc-dependent metalloprotease family protein [Pyrinomonadaceae bacterium]|jgi:hypothetical protein